MRLQMKNTFISDEIIIKCLEINHLTPNGFRDAAHSLCDNNNLVNAFLSRHFRCRQPVVAKRQLQLKRLAGLTASLAVGK